MRWKVKSNGEFTVRSFYETLQGSPPMPFPWKAICRSKTLRRVSFFAWMAVLEAQNSQEIENVNVESCCGGITNVAQLFWNLKKQLVLYAV